MATFDPYLAAVEIRDQLASEKRKLGFFFGAGASMAVGIPGIAALTDEVEKRLITEYQMSRCIGIATYSAVFNTNPRIEDPNVLILDDAHSAENYIAQLWTVSISRLNDRGLYEKLLRIACQNKDPWLLEKMLDDGGDPYGHIDLVPMPRLWPFMQDIIEAMDSGLQERSEAASRSKARTIIPWGNPGPWREA
jgi:hypothetical protein